jgi:hypothetical protein
MLTVPLFCNEAKEPILVLKTWPNQLIGSIRDDVSFKISNVKCNIVDVCNLINASISLSN